MEVYLRGEERETREEEEKQLRFRRTNHSGSKLKEKRRRNKGKHTRWSLQPDYEQRTLPACLPADDDDEGALFYFLLCLIYSPTYE